MQPETPTSLVPIDQRWETTFAQLVRRFGVARLARELDVAPAAVYQWVRGTTGPRSANAVKIVVLLKPLGRLTVEDIYQHRERIPH